MMRFILVGGFVLINCSSAFAVSQIDKLKEKASAGDPIAAYQVGEYYVDGPGQNSKEGVRWLLKAAEQGLADAQNAAGSLYQSGSGVEQDNSNAVFWYQKAADQGNLGALSNLGYMYDLGLGIKEDNAKAVNLYRSAAEKGYLQAMLNLGVMYWQGQGVARDDVEGFKWIELCRFYTTTVQDRKLKWRIRGAWDELKVQLSKNQIEEGKKRAQEWSKTHTVLKPGVSHYAN